MQSTRCARAIAMSRMRSPFMHRGGADAAEVVEEAALGRADDAALEETVDELLLALLDGAVQGRGGGHGASVPPKPSFVNPLTDGADVGTTPTSGGFGDHQPGGEKSAPEE